MRAEEGGGPALLLFNMTTSYKAELSPAHLEEDPEVRECIQSLLPGEDSPVRRQGRGRGGARGASAWACHMGFGVLCLWREVLQAWVP